MFIVCPKYGTQPLPSNQALYCICDLFKISPDKMSMLAYAFNSSIWLTETGGYL